MKTPLLVPNPQPKPGTVAKTAIQCTNQATGETGTFLFIGENHRDPLSVVSPTMDGIWDLFQWCKEHEWKANGSGYTKA
jgi:hypothetical protein